MEFNRNRGELPSTHKFCHEIVHVGEQGFENLWLLIPLYCLNNLCLQMLPGRRLNRAGCTLASIAHTLRRLPHAVKVAVGRRGGYGQTGWRVHVAGLDEVWLLDELLLLLLFPASVSRLHHLGHWTLHGRVVLHHWRDLLAEADIHLQCCLLITYSRISWLRAQREPTLVGPGRADAELISFRRF